MANTTLRHIRIDDELWDRLGSVLLDGESKSGAIRQWVEEHVTGREGY